jgi:hypothetical protein
VFLQNNLAIYEKRNAAELAVGGTAKHGITLFSDLSQDEFEKNFLGAVLPSEMKSALNTQGGLLNDAEVATSDESINWYGIYTSPIKNQGK